MIDNRCLLLANQIMDILGHGLTADEHIDTYLTSIFSNPSIDKLEQIISSHSHVERDSLVDLLLFPDETFQVALEPHLSGYRPSFADVQAVIHKLADSKLTITIHLPALHGEVRLRPTLSELERAIGRLNLTWLAPEALFRTIKPHFSKEAQILIRVWLRNANLKIEPCTTRILGDFLTVFNDTKPGFLTYFNFFIDFLNQKPSEPFLSALLKERDRMMGGLEQAVRFEAVVQEANMETLMLSGIRPSAHSSDYFRKKIVLIDDIVQALYPGKQVPKDDWFDY